MVSATRLDEATRATIERGRRVRAVLRQPEHHPIGAAEQVALLYAVNQGLFDHLPVERVPEAERAVRAAVRTALASLAGRLEGGQRLDEADWDALARAARDAVAAPEG